MRKGIHGGSRAYLSSGRADHGPDETLAEGATFGEYRVERLIGAGGMGAVYQAVQLSLDRRVALKVISPRLSSDRRFRELFQQEARHAASLEHPNVLPVHQAGEGPDGELFLSMRLIRGVDLGRHLQQRGSLPAAETVSILLQVASALDAAHAGGLVHRDVKPGNVLLEPREVGTAVYLSDFGLARRLEGGAVGGSAEGILGTVDYMAPEQIEGREVDETADVYAFGCLLYRCLAGEAPFRRRSASETMVAHLNAPVPLPSAAVAGVPGVLDLLTARALEKDPARRARSVSRLMLHAAAELGLETAAAKPRGHPPAPPRRRPDEVPRTGAAPLEQVTLTEARRRGGGGLLAALVAVLALAGLGVLTLTSREPATRERPAVGEAVEALELTGSGVRIAVELGGSLERLAAGPSPEARRTIERELASVADSTASLGRLVDRRLPRSAPARGALGQAQEGAEAATGALRQIAADPARHREAAVPRATRGYSELLGGLRGAVRAVQRRLVGAGALRSADARAIDSIDRGIASADGDAGASLARLADRLRVPR